MTKHKSETHEIKERSKFETWAEAVYGGDCSRHFVRDPQFPNEYKAADIQWAWQAWLYRARHRDEDENASRLAIEQEAAYYFREVRKFQPLDLNHLSLENWKDFIVWRESNEAQG